jgi:hypothetical protein
MSELNAAARDEILARLAASRAEIRRLLDPPPDESGGETPPGADRANGQFPRSRTMQLLMSGRGLGAVGALLGGVLVARPVLAWRLLRALPTGAVARMLILRALTAVTDRSRGRTNTDRAGSRPED